jgi:hypothetical protein
VIGKRGKTINLIKKNTQVTEIAFPVSYGWQAAGCSSCCSYCLPRQHLELLFQIPKQVTEDTLWGRVDLYGLSEAVFAGFSEIAGIVRGGGSACGSCLVRFFIPTFSTEVDDVVLKLRVEPRAHELLTSNRFETLKQISADHDVRICVPDRASRSNDVVEVSWLP